MRCARLAAKPVLEGKRAVHSPRFLPPLVRPRRRQIARQPLGPEVEQTPCGAGLFLLARLDAGVERPHKTEAWMADRFSGCAGHACRWRLKTLSGAASKSGKPKHSRDAVSLRSGRLRGAARGSLRALPGAFRADAIGTVCSPAEILLADLPDQAQQSEVCLTSAPTEQIEGFASEAAEATPPTATITPDSGCSGRQGVRRRPIRIGTTTSPPPLERPPRRSTFSRRTGRSLRRW